MDKYIEIQTTEAGTMCDTMVALGGVTKSGFTIFAKNSDREPNEPQVMLRIPRRRYDLSSSPKLKTTYTELDQVEETNEIVISKPSWMWGCEMGFNEYSVMIGNEAVFTKEAYAKSGLTGMDMIRLALERTKTAKDAADYIIYLLGRYGQGGNCGYSKKMHYHNSFIVADKAGAYVLETAGRYWVMKKVRDYYAISNGLTIENDFDACHPDLVADSIARKKCTCREDLNFKKAYSDPLYTQFSGSGQRWSLSMDLLGREKGKITPDIMISALRTHLKNSGEAFSRGSMKNLCMHGGGLVSSQTTASLVGELKDKSEYFYTASSLPCVSVFKPFVMDSDFELFKEEDQEKGTAYWTKREKITRMLLDGRLGKAEYIARRDAAEHKIRELYESAGKSTATKEETGAVLKRCMELDESFTDEMLQKGEASHPRGIKGSPYFRHYWTKENAALEN
ncbi:MAG: C69 family dipeptidase [Oscillospiraceae bacterium]|nr:C69 family dipeptidase [Oscillospiraceae bacterium]